MIRNLSEGVEAFTSNVFLATGERTVLVDAGSDYDVARAVREHVDSLDAVVLTHTHPDHVENVPALRDAFDVETWGFDPEHAAVDNAIADEETVRIGDDDYTALHTPGHRDDHLVFVSPTTAFVGDLVFANGAFGRTDLPQGDSRALVESVERLRDAIDEDVETCYTGHGPALDDPLPQVEASLRAARFNA